MLCRLPLGEGVGLGANRFELAEAFELPGVRLGLGWNRGDPPENLRGVLTDRFGSTDHVFDAAIAARRAGLLLVGFAAQGAGMQQWAAPAAAARAAGVELDVLYLADPSNSYYLQGPGGACDGVSHFAALVAEHTVHYPRVRCSARPPRE